MHYVRKKLVGKSLRPVIELDLFPGCLALIDTGAAIPVWTGEESQLATLEGARSTGRRESFSGFGGSVEGNIYELTLNFDGLYYIDLPVVASKMNNPWHIILPATLFDHMIYTIDNIQGIVIFETPDNQPVRHLKYQDLNGKTYILTQDTPRKRLA